MTNAVNLASLAVSGALSADANGNVGLGVTPSAWGASWKSMSFNTVGAVASTTGVTRLYHNAFNNDSNNLYRTTAAASMYSQDGAHAWFIAPSGTAGNVITFTQAMTLNASGVLLVGGTTARGSRLTLQCGEANAPALGTASGGVLFGNSDVSYGTLFGTTGAGSGWIQQQRVDGTATAYDLCLQPSGGNLLVGSTTLQTGNFDFTRTSGDSVLAVNRVGTLSNSQSSVLYAIGNKGSANVRQAAIFVFKNSNITNPCGALNLQCEDAAQNYLWADNSDVFRISTDPNNIGTTGGTVVGTQTSDERLKNISGAISYGLTEVMALEPIAFTMKDSPEVAKIGFSAQQVQPIIPESVYDTGECIDGYDVDPDNKLITTPKSDRTKLAMEYTQLIPVLTKAIQEQQAMIDELKAKVAALEGAA